VGHSVLPKGVHRRNAC